MARRPDWVHPIDTSAVRRYEVRVHLAPSPPTAAFEHKTLTVEQVRTLYKSLESDRLEHLHPLALHGLRRGALAGLLWEDIDLDSSTPTLTIRHQRLVTEGGAVDGSATKTDAGERTLPIPSTLQAVLKRARTRSEEERLAAGSHWQGRGHVVHSEFGAPYFPTSINDFWHRALDTAGVPRVRLDYARHTAAMRLGGVPIALIAAWLGHTDSAFTQRTYAHSQDDSLRPAVEAYAKAVAGKPKRSRARKG
jgi:integrase